MQSQLKALTRVFFHVLSWMSILGANYDANQVPSAFHSDSVRLPTHLLYVASEKRRGRIYVRNPLIFRVLLKKTATWSACIWILGAN